MGRVISTAIQFIDGFTKPSRAVIDSMNKMASNIKKNAGYIQKAGKTISSVGSAMNKAMTLPLAGAATAAIKMSNDFENAMEKVGTIADTTVMPMVALKEQVINLSNAVGVGVASIAEAQYQAISAGVDTAASVDFVSTAVKAAKGGFTDTATAVDGLTTVLNAYGLEASKATSISDQMLAAQNFGKTSFGDMASSIGKVIPIASSLNVSTEELFSSIAVLTKNGIATSEAITGLKAAYSNVLKPSAEAGKAAKQLGLDFSSAYLKSVGWAKFLDEIKEKTGGNAETMAKLFGSTEALNSVTVLAGKGSADFAKALELMAKSSGMAEAAYKKMLTPTERMSISLNKIKNSLIQFGAVLTPVFDKVAGIINAVGDRLNSLNEEQINAVVRLAAMAAAIGPMIMIFGKLVTMAGAVHKAWGNVIRIFAKFGGVIGVITSPAGIVIGVLAAIAAAAFLIIKNWDKVKGFLQGVGGWFKNAFEKAGFSAESFKAKFVSIGNTVGSITGKIGGFCKAAASMFKEKFGGAISAGVAKAGSLLEGLAGGAAVAFDGLVGAADKGLQAFDAFLGFFAGAFAGNWESAAKGFRESLKDIFPPGMAAGLVKAFDTALPGVQVAVAGIKAALSGIVQDAGRIFGDFTAMFQGVVQFAKSVISGDWQGALDALKAATKGVFDGLAGMVKMPLDLIVNAVKGAFGAFKGMGAVKSVFTGIGNAVKGALSKCGVDLNKFSTNLSNIKARAGSILGGLKTIFTTVFGVVGNAVKAVSRAIAKAFGVEVSSACSAAGAAIAAFKAVAGAAFNFVAAVVQKAMAVIVPVVKVAFSAVGGAVSAAVDGITGVISGLMTVFDGIITFVSGVFTGNWTQAWEGIKTVFGGVFDSLVSLCKMPINAVIGIINGAIAGINKLGLTIPDWVPGIGGKAFSISIPPIPMLYRGTDNWRGGAAVIHDRGGEIVDLPKGTRVYPHDKSVQMARKEGERNGAGGIHITIQKLADKVEIRSDEDIDRIAQALAMRLKKVAMNTGAI